MFIAIFPTIRRARVAGGEIMIFMIQRYRVKDINRRRWCMVSNAVFADFVLHDRPEDIDGWHLSDGGGSEPICQF